MGKPVLEEQTEYTIASRVLTKIKGDETLAGLWGKKGWSWKIGIFMPTPEDKMPLFSCFVDLKNQRMVGGGKLWELTYRIFVITAWNAMGNPNDDLAMLGAVATRIRAIHKAQIDSRYGMSTTGMRKISNNIGVQTDPLEFEDWPNTGTNSTIVWRKYWFDCLYTE
jgi:hypothetical protein